MKIIVIGAAGKMGQSVVKIAKEQNITISALIDAKFKEKNKLIFDDNICFSDVLCVDNSADVIIDFSTAISRKQFIKFAYQNKIAYCCFGTAISKDDKLLFKNLAKTNRVLVCSNASMGMIVFKKLIKTVLSDLPGAQACLTDIHNKNKKDAPSGTALAIKNEFDLMNRGLAIASFRASNVCGEHRLSFYRDDEELTLTHKIMNRDVFSRGAIELACQLIKKPAGYYEM